MHVCIVIYVQGCPDPFPPQVIPRDLHYLFKHQVYTQNTHERTRTSNSPVRNNNDSSSGHQVVQRSLHNLLTLRVERTRRLIQQKNLGV